MAKAKLKKYIYDRYKKEISGGTYEYRGELYTIFFDYFDSIKKGALYHKHKEEQDKIDKRLATTEYIPTEEERKEITKKIDKIFEDFYEILNLKE